MARSHGRLLARIWSDDDFIALPVEAQRLYMLLISQPNVTHAGTMSITVRRWARMSQETSVESIMRALRTLSDTQFVVVDWDTEELLIRTLVRNDGVFKQPRVFQVAAGEMRAVSSAKVRGALRLEVMRLPLDEVSDKARPDVQAEVDKLLAELPDTPPDTPGATPADTPPFTPADGSPTSAGKGTGKGPSRGRARGGSPSPAPAPTPSPTPVSDGADEPPPALRVVEDEDQPDARPVVAAYIDGATTAGRPRPSDRLIGLVGRDAKRLLAGTSLDLLVAAAKSMGGKGFDNLDRELQRMPANPVSDLPVSQRWMQANQ